MLGEMVDHGFEAAPKSLVDPGQIIGWVEGFKAISDLFCVALGNFAGGNSLLKEKIAVVNKDPYGAGWLYVVKGKPDSRCVDVHGYRAILDKTIDKILEKQKSELAKQLDTAETERDALRKQLSQRTTERDTAHTNLLQFSKELQALAGRVESALNTTPQNPNLAIVPASRRTE